VATAGVPRAPRRHRRRRCGVPARLHRAHGVARSHPAAGRGLPDRRRTRERA